MTSRADVAGTTDGKVAKGASRVEMALRHYRAIIVISIVLVVLSVM